MIAQFISTIGSNLPQILQQGIEIIGKLVAGLIQAIPQVVAAIPKIISSIVDTFGKYDWLSIGKNIIDGIANGIKNAAGVIADAAKNAAKKAFDAAKDFLGIKSPSKLMRDKVGRYISEGIAVGIEDNLNSITNSMNDVADLVSQPIDVGEVGMTGGSGSRSAYNTSNSVVINVYGAVGQNVNELAEIVSRKINASVNRRGAAWA
jgi:phage-related protein